MNLTRRSVTALLVGLVCQPPFALAQTPLLERYNRYFSTPFERGDDLAILAAPEGSSLPISVARSIADEVFLQHRRDELRIERVLSGRGPDTGYEDADGDGVVRHQDLAALEGHVVELVRAMVLEASDDELGIPGPWQVDTFPDPEKAMPVC